MTLRRVAMAARAQRVAPMVSIERGLLNTSSMCRGYWVKRSLPSICRCRVRARMPRARRRMFSPSATLGSLTSPLGFI
jgi:hypothetical protein